MGMIVGNCPKCGAKVKEKCKFYGGVKEKIAG